MVQGDVQKQSRYDRRVQLSKPGQKRETALVLSAGAPHAPLMAGALCAIVERDKVFDIVYTSGAGALIGLLLVAPKDKEPREALRSVLDLAIADEIYSLLPINYKVFLKPGPFTKPIQQWAQLFKLGEASLLPEISDPGSTLGHWYNHWIGVGQTWRNASGGHVRRLYNDWIDLWAAAITPTTLNYWSQGLCEPLPFLEKIIDFDQLNEVPNDFFLNFMSLHDARGGKTRQAMKTFASRNIRPEEVRAAFAFPFIYTPVKVGGELMFEGANWEPISFGNLFDPEYVRQDLAGVTQDVRTVVLMDIVTPLERFVLREPRNLWDAFGLSIMMPVVAHAKKELARIAEYEGAGRYRFEILRMDFGEYLNYLDEESGARVTDWSYSNMSRMFEIGLKVGTKFLEAHGDRLSDLSKK